MPGLALCSYAYGRISTIVPALSSDVVSLVVPARAASHESAAGCSIERQYLAAAAQAWRLQFELAWSYPRIWYIVWSRLIDDFLVPARERHGHERWDHAEREGAALNVHDAIDLALERGPFAPVTVTTTEAGPS